MAEGQVTADGTTYRCGPFMVVATAKPVEMDGAFPLPEAQRDRFHGADLHGLPDTDAEVAMLSDHGPGSPWPGWTRAGRGPGPPARAGVGVPARVHRGAPLHRGAVQATRSTPTCAWGRAPRRPAACRRPPARTPPWQVREPRLRTTSA
ncbi:AAA family ATPase [Kocuria rhizophila]|nr:AAA family ATPase [Kocuria rhizophila]